MTEAIVKYNVNGDIETLQRTAKMLAVSGFFDAKGPPEVQIAQMATKILAGAELGFGPFASVQGIHLIQGKPAIGANLMAAAVKSHPSYDYRVRKMDDTECEIEFFETIGGKRESLGISGFTKKDAEAAGLMSNPTWKKYPKNMLFARAMSNGVRFYTPDVFNGSPVYVPEELGANVDGDGNVIDTTWTESPKPPSPAPTQPAPEVDFGGVGDGPFDDVPEPQSEPLPQTLVKKLHATGVHLYGKEWDDKRPALVSAITKQRTESSKELTIEEAQRLIEGMENKIAAQPVAA